MHNNGLDTTRASRCRAKGARVYTAECRDRRLGLGLGRGSPEARNPGLDTAWSGTKNAEHCQQHILIAVLEAGHVYRIRISKGELEEGGGGETKKAEDTWGLNRGSKYRCRVPARAMAVGDCPSSVKPQLSPVASPFPPSFPRLHPSRL